MKHLLFVTCFLMISSAFSQNEFDAARISPLLKNDANAVIRLQEIVFKIKNLKQSSRYERIVVTILNEKGENEFSDFSRGYDKFNKIKDLEGSVYDGTGKKIRSLKKSDIKDFSNFDAAYEITDSRQKVAFFDKKKYSYPYTIEFACTEESNSGMFYPTWMPCVHEYVGVEKSLFSVIKPLGIDFRYKEMNLPVKVSVTKTEDAETYTWALKNRGPVKFEDYMNEEQLPVVFTAPGNFEVETYAGNASSWKEIGKFYFALNQNRDELPQNIKQTIHSLIQNETDTVKMIGKLYDYVQSTTRYISLQLGIGGWQTITAADVAQKGYGDCKGLSNYMMAILKEAGIKSNRVLILAGRQFFQIQPDFPSFRFNHAIVCVPLKNDSIWLDCTSQTSAMGYMGTFTGNRKALIITDDDGVLVNTVKYLPKDNVQHRKIMVNVDEKGNALVNTTTLYTGIKQENPSRIVHYLNKEKQKDEIIQKLMITNFELLSFSFKEDKKRLPQIEENLELKINKLIPVSKSAVLITPNLLPDPIELPVDNGDKLHSFYLDPNSYNYSMSDTVIYHFSNQFSLESLPAPVYLQSKFGEYKISFSFKNNQLMYCRNLTLLSGTFPNTDYQSWISFVKQVNKNDRQRIALVPKS